MRGGSLELPLFFCAEEFLSAFGKLIPVLIVVVLLFALYQLYTAIMFLTSKQYAFGVFNLVFSFAGVALARALWINRSRYR